MADTDPVRVLYVAGTGRSGSTLVSTILGHLPGVFSAGELRFLWLRGVTQDQMCGCGARFSACPVWVDVMADLEGRLPVGTRLDPAGFAHRLRRRTRVRLPAFRVLAGDARHSIELPKSWLARNALTAAALESEARQWEAVGRQLLVRRMT